LRCAVSRAAGGAAYRSGEATALGEITVNVEPLGRSIEIAPRYNPWRSDAERDAIQG